MAEKKMTKKEKTERFNELSELKKTQDLTPAEQEEFEVLYVELNQEAPEDKDSQEPIKPVDEAKVRAELAAREKALADKEKALKEKEAAIKKHELELNGPTPETYKVPKGQEHLLHLKISRGYRFDAMTGKPCNERFVQTFNKSEWNNLKKTIDYWPCNVEAILYDPFGDAEEVLKDKIQK